MNFNSNSEKDITECIKFQPSDFQKIPYLNTICYVRRPEIEIKYGNNYIEMLKAMQFLQNDDYKKHPYNYIASQFDDIKGDFKEDQDEFSRCICSCDKCNSLYPVYHKPTKTYLAVGSVCITKFINDKFENKLRCKKLNGACLKCNEPLCLRSSQYLDKNYSKKNNNVCDDCLETTVILSKNKLCYFHHKIDLDKLQNVKNNIWIYNGLLPKFLKEYTLCYLKISFNDKDKVKKEFGYKIAWDSDKKSWYCMSRDLLCIESFIAANCR